MCRDRTEFRGSGNLGRRLRSNVKPDRFGNLWVLEIEWWNVNAVVGLAMGYFLTLWIF